jgi:AcrR family transcriptional regulator
MGRPPKRPRQPRRRQQRPARRSGRPPRQFAGEVEARILDAARRVFLQRGLAGASIDEIAALARAGKPSIYARFADKEALFEAVVMRNVAAAIERFGSNVPAGATIDERLANLGATILHWVLTANIDLMRVAISEGRRFPNLASNVHHMARQRGEEVVARLLSEAALSDPLGVVPAFAPERLATTARVFIDLVVFPLITRALFGEKPESLRAEIEPHLARSVAFFLAACQHRGVD